MRFATIIWAACVAWAGSMPAYAEQGEKSVGLEAAMLLPGFESTSATAFALATWSVGGCARYGLLDDLEFVTRASFASFHGSMKDTQSYAGRPIEGVLRFSTSQLRVEMGARYKLLAGYPIAPYLEAASGVVFSTFKDQRLSNDTGADYGLSIANAREAAPTLSVGVTADYRLLNMFFIGLAVRYVQALGGRTARAVVAPLELSYYW